MTPTLPAPAPSSNQIEAMFAAVASAVFGLLDDVRRISQLTAALADMVGPDRAADFTHPVQVVCEALQQIEAESTDLFSTMRDLHDNAARLRSLLHDQGGDVQMASMVATNARVVSSSIPKGDDALSRFAEDVQHLLREAAARIGEVETRLIAADIQLRRTVPLVRHLKETAAGLIALGAGLPAAMEAVASSGLDRSAGRIGSDLDRLARSLETAVGHLQAGDAVRQRFEHAAAIRGIAQQRTGAHRVALVHLADRQDAAAATALEEAAALLLPEIEQMSATCTSVAAHLTGFIRLGARTDLQAIAAIIAGISEGVQTLRREKDLLQPALGGLVDFYGGVGADLQRANDLNRDMGLLSLNAILASGQLGYEGRALMEVSRQLRETTSQIGRQSLQIAELSQRQEGSIEQLRQRAHRAVQTDFGAVLTGLQGQVDRFGAALAALHVSADAWVMTSPLGDLRQILDRILAQGRWRQPSGPDPHDLDFSLPEVRADMDRIRALYTMRAERDLHDSLLDGTPSSPPTPATTTEDTLDSVFF